MICSNDQAAVVVFLAPLCDHSIGNLLIEGHAPRASRYPHRLVLKFFAAWIRCFANHEDAFIRSLQEWSERTHSAIWRYGHAIDFKEVESLFCVAFVSHGAAGVFCIQDDQSAWRPLTD